ncbi:MAG: hypothetical protein U1U88_001147 [Lawsonella clevelandensis]
MDVLEELADGASHLGVGEDDLGLSVGEDSLQVAGVGGLGRAEGGDGDLATKEGAKKPVM